MNNYIIFISTKVFPIGTFLAFAAYLIMPDSGKALTLFYVLSLIPALFIFPFTFTSILKSVFFWPLIIFLAYLPLTVLWSSNPNAEDLIFSIKLSFYLLIFANALKQNTLWLKKYFSYLGFIAAACALTTTVYFYGYLNNPFAERLTAWGDMQNSLWAGTIFAFFAAFFAFALLTRHIDKSCKFIFTLSHISLWILITAALLTQSKGPIIALALSTLLLSIIIKSKKGMVTTLGMSIVAIALISINNEALSNLLSRGTSFRIDIWLASIEAIMQHFIFGHGVNHSVIIITPDSNLFVSPHNRLLAVLYHGGIVGGVLLLWMFYPVFARQKFISQSTPFLITLQGLIIFFILCSMSEGRYLVTRPNFIWLELWLPLFTYFSILSFDKASLTINKD